MSDERVNAPPAAAGGRAAALRLLVYSFLFFELALIRYLPVNVKASSSSSTSCSSRGS